MREGKLDRKCDQPDRLGPMRTNQNLTISPAPDPANTCSLLTKLPAFTTKRHTGLAQGSEKLGNKIQWEMEEKELPAAPGVASRPDM